MYYNCSLSVPIKQTNKRGFRCKTPNSSILLIPCNLHPLLAAVLSALAYAEQQALPEGCVCAATDDLDPVCGNNGVTYPNLMTLRCADQCVKYSKWLILFSLLHLHILYVNEWHCNFCLLRRYPPDASRTLQDVTISSDVYVQCMWSCSQIR